MLVLGYDCYIFDAAACLVHDGRLVAAAQEERFNREKFSGRFPEAALRYCLDTAGATLADVDHVAFYWRPFHQIHRRARQILSTLPGSLRYWNSHGPMFWSLVRARHELVRRLGRGKKPRFRFHQVPHHLAHAACAFLLSPFDRAATLTLDGAGEMTSAAMGLGEGNTVRLFTEVPYPHSMGYVYCAFTQYLGFTPDSDEYKVMALASYGEPSEYDALLEEIIGLEDDGTFRIDTRYFDYPAGGRDPWVSRRFLETFGPMRRPGEPVGPREQRIAWALQRRLEAVALNAAHALHRRTGARRLVVAGGTALNSVMNQRLLADGPFDEVWVPPVPNDAGAGLGAAAWVHTAIDGGERFALETPYLGPQFDEADCRRALEARGLTGRRLSEDALASAAADRLASGAVIGWFQGRMELGPRALGNRSILADPRDPAMQARVNEKVKHRESFRPFAPAVLVSEAHRYFEDARPLPYMVFVVPVRPEKRAEIPAVTHVDGTARVQTVSPESNPLFHRLISAFGERTGVPVVLNTSFNDSGEPIVCTPSDALATFERTGLDALYLGPFEVLP